MNRAFSKILILIIVVVLIGGGVLIWQYQKAPEVKLPEKEVAEEMAKEIDECKGIQDLDKQSKCYVDLAKETKNETLCGKITAFELRADCYTELAILKNDPSICERIEPRGSMYESCHEYFEEVIKKPEIEKPTAKEEKILDSDGDGVPDNRDDYPEDPSWSAKLEVLHSNWYRHLFSESYPQGERVTAVLRFKNPKSIDVYNRIEGFVTFKNADGVRVGWASMVYRTTILRPGEEGFLFQEEEVLDKEVTSIEVEVKGQLKETAWKILPKLNVEISSHNGAYEPATERYVVSGKVKNNENRPVDVYVWAGFYDSKGTLLDVQFDGIWNFAAGGLAEFNVESKTPNANKISTYELSIASGIPLAQ